MRDIVGGIGAEAVRDPMRVANERRTLPKRFYSAVSIEPAGNRWELRLDGRPVRTPGKAVVAVSSETVAEALADEWRAQKEHIDPVTMPIMRIVNSAVDGVAGQIDAVREDVVAFAGSDMLCYRADGPDGLVARQAEAWDPVLARFAEADDARFVLAEGVMPVEQPAAALSAIEEIVGGMDDPVRLAALHVATTLTGSALLACALYRGWLSVDEAWVAAHVDEDWNRELWGTDEEAEARRTQRRRDMDAGGLILSA